MSGSCEPGVISGDMETAVLMRIKKLPGGSRGEAGEKSPFLSSEEAGRYTLEDAAGATADLRLILGNPPLNSCLCQAPSRGPPRHLDGSSLFSGGVGLSEAHVVACPEPHSQALGELEFPEDHLTTSSSLPP